MKSDTGKASKYFVASRAKEIGELKIKTRKNMTDGVIIYSVYKDDADNTERLVLIRQYRLMRMICSQNRILQRLG